MVDVPAVIAPTAPPRALALDALRGLAILLMCLSGVVPWGALPTWMYHAQYVPPAMKFDPTVAGFTWVDLVFPLFLFSMGAAFPFALTARLGAGARHWRIVLGVLLRGLSLVAFAIYVQHIAPHRIAAAPDTRVWLLALLGFALLFPIYMRYPRHWKPKVTWTLRAVGVAGAAALLASLDYRGEPFDVNRSDIIILVLANMAVAGSLLWLITRHSWTLRVALLLVVAAALSAYRVEGSWVRRLFESPAPWIYRFDFMKYLFIVIPGTIAGDLLLQWNRSGIVAPGERSERRGYGLLSLLLVALVVFIHVGLQARWQLATPLVALPFLGGIWLLIFRKPAGDATASILRQLFAWGAFWLVLGLVYEPTEGGIKKDPSTMSYYFVSTGLSLFLLIALAVWIDLFRWVKPFRLFILNGQNPMLAYVGIRNLLAPVVNLTGMEKLVFANVVEPWLRFVWSVAKTAGLAVVVGLCTRWKIIWRT